MATADQVIKNAAKHIGVSGTDNIFNTWVWGFHCYDPDTYPWCAAFASYVLIKESGVKAQASASAAGIANQFQRINDSEVQKGDVVVFNWDGRNDTSWCDHVGLVEWFDHGSELFGTIEGNTGYSAEGEVARVTRNNNAGYFTAFFRPDYDGSSSSGSSSGGSSSSGSSSSSSGGKTKKTAKWRAKMKGKKRVNGQSGATYAGVKGRPIRYLAIDGVGTYQVSDINHGWWPKVSKYDLNDEENGMAGNGDPVDRVRIDDPTVYYQTHNLGGDWNEPMQGLKDSSSYGDDFAGDKGVQQDLIRIWRAKGKDQPSYRVYS